MEMKDYYVGDIREPVRYIEKMSRGGLSKMPPLIITCAITGGLHGNVQINGYKLKREDAHHD